MLVVHNGYMSLSKLNEVILTVILHSQCINDVLQMRCKRLNIPV